MCGRASNARSAVFEGFARAIAIAYFMRSCLSMLLAFLSFLPTPLCSFLHISTLPQVLSTINLSHPWEKIRTFRTCSHERGRAPSPPLQTLYRKMLEAARKGMAFKPLHTSSHDPPSFSDSIWRASCSLQVT